MTAAALQPLAKIHRMTAVCEDCGRRSAWDRAKIARERLRRGFRSLEELGSKLTCSACVKRGTDGKNISIYPNLVEAVISGVDVDRASPPAITVFKSPDWSRAEVFGENRTDPYVNLPASKLMRGI